MYSGSVGLIWGQIFTFPDGNPESVFWSRYISVPDGVHTLGQARQERRRQIKPEYRYAGFVAATVGAVRNIVTKRNHRMRVYHAPEDGQGNHHAEIAYNPNGGTFDRSDRNELKLALKRVFEEHGAIVAFQDA